MAKITSLDHETGWRARLRALTDDRRFVRTTIGVILFNAVVLGLLTFQWPADVMTALKWLDYAALAYFTLEVGLRIVAHGLRFFRQGWGAFDFLVVAVSLAATDPTVSILRALRILRVLRVFTAAKGMRRVIAALFHSLPSMGGVVGVMSILFYISAVMATELFGEAFPEWFGDLGASLYSLFQIMTLESWSMGIVRPVMDEQPMAWLFFVPFIVMTSFLVLNLAIGVVVNSLQAIHDAELAERGETPNDELIRLRQAVETLSGEVCELRRAMGKEGDADGR
jgi:voltage-gated sodium channel